MYLSLNKLQNVLLEFVETKMLPVAPPLVKFMIGGAIPVALGSLDKMIAQYRPMLETLDIIDPTRLNIDKASEFIRGGFSKTDKINIYNFTFDKNDGEYLIGLLEKYKDE